MNKIDVVMQGPFFNALTNNAKRFVDLQFVNKVIISTWEDVSINDEIINHEKVILIKNRYPEISGPTGTSLALISSLAGIKKAESDIVIKLRSDYDVPVDSLQQLYNYYETHKNDKTKKYLDGSKQFSKIFVTGIGLTYPYHIQDHTYCGNKNDLIKVFDIPPEMTPPYGEKRLDNSPTMFNVENQRFRAPIHIGAHYYSKFYEKAKHHLEHWEDFFCDNSPHKQEALDFYWSIKENIFKPFPRIKIYWEKYDQEYPYEWYGSMGEYYAD